MYLSFPIEILIKPSNISKCANTWRLLSIGAYRLEDRSPNILLKRPNRSWNKWATRNIQNGKTSEFRAILTNGRSSPDAAPSRRRGWCRRACFETLVNPVKAEILFVRARAATLPLLLIVIQVEALVLDESDAEQTEIRPQFVHQLVLTAVRSCRRGKVQLPAKDRREDVELLMIEAQGGRRERWTATAAAADGGAPDGTDAACTGTPGTSRQVVSQGDAGLTLLRSLVPSAPVVLSQPTKTSSVVPLLEAEPRSIFSDLSHSSLLCFHEILNFPDSSIPSKGQSCYINVLEQARRARILLVDSFDVRVSPSKSLNADWSWFWIPDSSILCSDESCAKGIRKFSRQIYRV